MKNAQIIVVASEKGGPGKTTLVKNFESSCEARGKIVLVLDLEKNQSLVKFAKYRKSLHGENSKIKEMKSVSPTEKTDVKAFLNQAKQHFDFIIVDTSGGVDQTDLATVIALSDIVITPVRTSVFDLSTDIYVTKIIENVRKSDPDSKFKACTVLVKESSMTKTEEEKVREFLTTSTDSRILLNSAITLRKAYQIAANAGLGVCELKTPAGRRATEEFEDVMREILKTTTRKGE